MKKLIKHSLRQFKKNFKNIIYCLVVALCLIYTSSMILNVAEGHHIETDSDNYLEITVEEGDTLWHLAGEYNHSDKDIRQVVYEIREYNHLSSADIYPGQILLIPVN